MNIVNEELAPLPPVTPGRFRHYKGGEYELVGVARDSETLAPMALYRPLYGAGDLWVRPWKMFFEDVVVDGRLVPRFAPLAP
ncbi:MAG TPA: DUF1653 domain-containing protein [Ramlibacter sp.]|nr:DUF1653 domain-containing protein [Ramlibacter sp.]